MRILIPFSLLLLLADCKTKRSETEAADGIMHTDREFNAYCKAHGRSAAFMHFASDSALQMRERAVPLRGLQEIRAFYMQINDTSSNLSWEPEFGMVSGNLGYTFGWWSFKAKPAPGKDTVLTGNYVTIWKKQADGSWKYILDGGNSAPRR
jgi:ketosteroid isomerase-like protein